MECDEIWEFVTNGHTGIFVTLRADGVPIAMPLWFAVLDRRIYISTRGKKLSRIRNDERASFLVESGKRWAELKAVHLTGTARVLADPGVLEGRIKAELDRKYDAFRTVREQMPATTRRRYEASDHAYVEFIPDDRILNWDNHRLQVGCGVQSTRVR
jgi:nitroimidazol reductase NimA-like FMN-containing flavoprotein (pyridoxamine 5'-phosphate oxidase superfamily)